MAPPTVIWDGTRALVASRKPNQAKGMSEPLIPGFQPIRSVSAKVGDGLAVVGLAVVARGVRVVGLAGDRRALGSGVTCVPQPHASTATHRAATPRRPKCRNADPRAPGITRSLRGRAER